MKNEEQTKSIAATLHQIVQAHQFSGQQAEMVMGLKGWLEAIMQDQLVVTNPAQTQKPVSEGDNK